MREGGSGRRVIGGKCRERCPSPPCYPGDGLERCCGGIYSLCIPTNRLRVRYSGRYGLKKAAAMSNHVTTNATSVFIVYAPCPISSINLRSMAKGARGASTSDYGTEIGRADTGEHERVRISHGFVGLQDPPRKYSKRTLNRL